MHHIAVSSCTSKSLTNGYVQLFARNPAMLNLPVSNIKLLTLITQLTNCLSDYIGDIPTASCLSVAAIYVILVLKAVFWVRNKLSLFAVTQGLGITIGSGLIVVAIYFISNDGFDRATRFFCVFSNSCK